MRYFDHNASAPLLPAARTAWLEASEQFFGNPSSPHRVGGRADRALTDARERLAGFLGCEPLDVAWTSGATESANLVMHHAAVTLDPATEVWLSGIEHPSVLRAATTRFPGRHRFIPVSRAGQVDLHWLSQNLRKNRPGLIAVMAANNETGVHQPWREVLALCQEHGVPFFCDAAQWLGRESAAGLGQSDWVSGCAHKFGGPRGIGFLKGPARGRWAPLMVGGPQEDGRRAGTENVAGALALVAALAEREGALARHEQASRLAWRSAFEQTIRQQLPGCEIVGEASPRLWNTVSALMPAADCQKRWVVKLDKAGFATSTGSACASGQEKASHVLLAMGYHPDEASRVLRFSSGWETTPEDWQALAAALAGIQEDFGGSSTAEQLCGSA